MRKTIHKLMFAWQYGEEEQWLNDMSDKGLSLVHAGLCTYIFEDNSDEKYNYKVQLLSGRPSSNKNQQYLKFLEETGVEHISSILKWVYLRKKKSDGPFELYSDLPSRIKYFKRLQLFYFLLMILEFSVGIMNISLAFQMGLRFNMINFLLGLLLMVLGVMFVIAVICHTKKIKMLKLENQIHE